MFKKGDTYRNTETHVPFFIRNVKNDTCQVVWCFKCATKLEDWPRKLDSCEEVIEGPDGYVEYRVTKSFSNLMKEITGPYGIVALTPGTEDKFILDWIPQHTFIAAK